MKLKLDAICKAREVKEMESTTRCGLVSLGRREILSVLLVRV